MSIDTIADHAPLHPQTQLRSPQYVMRLERMGSFFPTRLSFLRSLLRKLASEGAGVARSRFNLDEDGYGEAVYEVMLDGMIYSLIAFSCALDPANRTDRVIAEAWDACFVLYDGRPSEDEIEELRDQAIHQEAGRYHPKVLVLSRANKSVRLFDHVVEALSRGHQPDAELLGKTGYLMRTTAVYGNGKFGMADRADIVGRPTLSQPFRLEMLAVYLIREFTFDLVNYVAKAKGGDDAVKLEHGLCRRLGIGNSTGLGMAPFLVNHPVLINNWMMARETALARVCAVERVSEAVGTQLKVLVERISAHLEQWNVDDDDAQNAIENLRLEWQKFSTRLPELLNQQNPFEAMVKVSRKHSLDLQELVVAFVLEPHGDLVDGLCDCMEATHEGALDPVMKVGELRDILLEQYHWALELDLQPPEARAMVWYVSEEKLEPRFGERRNDLEHREMPHHIAHKVQALSRALNDHDDDEPLAVLLMAQPQHRDIVRRVQTIAQHPYGEVQDNLVAKGVRPIDLLRCKLSFFGASKFDPRSDRWTRITLYQGAPTIDDLTPENCGDVFLPAF